MPVTSVRDRLPPDVVKELDASGTDVASFLAKLHDDQRIDTPTLCSLVGSLEVELQTRDVGKGGETAPLGLLGKGAMGEVLLAKDTRLNRHVALKRILEKGRQDPVALRRFQQEAQIMAQLDHPAIAPVYGVETGADGVAGYAMKLVRGQTLSAYLATARTQAQQGGYDEDHALPARLDIFLQVCNAVHYAHTRGVIHRDLKPANIMIGAYGEVLVMDWGIARLIGKGPDIPPQPGEEGAPTEASSTMVGMAIGTPTYMSPEQATGENDKLDGLSDQYTLGMILQEVVTLGRARLGNNPTHVLYRAGQGEKDPMVSAVGEPVARELKAIVDKATSKDPKKRYADVDALADDVRRFLRDEPVVAAPDGLVQRMARFVARHRNATLGAGAALGVVAFGAVGVTIGGAAFVLEATRYAAAEREAAMQHLSSVVATQARTIDQRLQRYQSLLTGVGYAATHALRTEPPAGATWLLQDQIPAHPEVIESAAYHDKIVFDVPVMWQAPGTPDEVFLASAPRLAGLRDEMVRALLLSKDDATPALPRDQQRVLVADQGVPAVWLYIGLADGTMIQVPAAGGYPDDYDHRVQEWYGSMKSRRTVSWDPAGQDASDNPEIGLLVTAGIGLWSGDESVGVAGLDVSVKYVVGEMLAIPELGPGVDTWLLEGVGRTIATSTDLKGTPPFPYAKDLPTPLPVTGAVAIDDPTGTKLVVWSRLESLDWTYVVVGRESDLLR